jgi:hypothetical protein
VRAGAERGLYGHGLLVTDDTGAFVDVVTQVLDGEVRARVVTEDGSIGHGEITVGDTVVPAFDRRTEWPVMPGLLRVFVPDADVAFAGAAAAGASWSPSSPTAPSGNMGPHRGPARHHLVGRQPRRGRPRVDAAAHRSAEPALETCRRHRATDVAPVGVFMGHAPRRRVCSRGQGAPREEDT